MEKNIIVGEELERTIESNLGELTYMLLQSYEENIIQVNVLLLPIIFMGADKVLKIYEYIIHIQD